MSSFDAFISGEAYPKGTTFDNVKGDFLRLFTEIAEDHGLDKKKLEEIGKRAAKVISWKYTASGEEERRQADIAYEILTKEIPITLKGMISSETVARGVAKMLVFGLKVAKLMVAM